MQHLFEERASLDWRIRQTFDDINQAIEGNRLAKYIDGLPPLVQDRVRAFVRQQIEEAVAPTRQTNDEFRPYA